MYDHLLDAPVIHMPDFGPGEWLHSDRPLHKETLRGQVVLVDFWDYTCVNCLRTLPYVKAWHRRYAALGLTVIGIHVPEFKFGHDQHQVEAAIRDFELSYPIQLDNQYETWSRFANRAWPTKYLIDPDGYIRFNRQGEGHYRATELAIQSLLRHRNPDVQLPDILPPLRDEDASGAVCYRTTPELYAGYQGGGLFGGALGNEEGYVLHNPMFYDLPAETERTEGHFYVDGVWRAWPEALAYAGQDGGRLVLPYTAVSVTAVLSPSPDPVETMLNIQPSSSRPIVEIRQDGRYLTRANAGADVRFDRRGASYVLVRRPRLYELVNNIGYESHELSLTFRANSLSLFAFAFTTCVAHGPEADTGPTYRVP